MELSYVIYFVSLAMTLGMIYMILNISKRNKRAKKLIDLVNVFDDKEVFFKEVDNYVSTINNEEFSNKGLIIKLWGLIYYERYDEVLDTAKQIYFIKIVKKTKKGYSVELNEDSMYYYLLASMNTLYSVNRLDLMKELGNLFNIKNEVKDTLVYAMYESNNKFYFKEDDLGEGFYKAVLDGDYGQYDYSKGLIGLYKNIITSILGRLYIDKERFEDFEGLKEDLINFNKTTIGGRYIQELKLNDYLKVEE